MLYKSKAHRTSREKLFLHIYSLFRLHIFLQLQDENRRLLSNQQKYQNEIFKVSQDNEFLREKTDQLQEVDF